MRFTTIRRRGVRILKSYSAWPGKAEFEYFGYPLHGEGCVRKIGRARRVGHWQYYALRDMRAGVERMEFNSLLDAEEWIAHCDSWGELERASIEVPEH